MKLYLDDIRNPPDDSWTLARSYEEAVELVNTHGFPTEISLDHDLGMSEYNGYNLLCWLLYQEHVEHPDTFIYTFHTMNFSGKQRMELAIAEYIRHRIQEGLCIPIPHQNLRGEQEWA